MNKLSFVKLVIHLMSAVVPMAAYAAASPFGPAVSFGTDVSGPGILNSPRLATDRVGTWIAVWGASRSFDDAYGSDLDILVARSLDDGATWAPAILNSNAASDVGSDSFADVATDGAGTWVAVWESDDTLGGTLGSDDDILFARSTDDGVTWSAPAALNTNASADSGNDRTPRIATDDAGNWVTVWSTRDLLGGPLGTDPDLLVARSSNGGASWSAPAPLNSGAASDALLDVAPALVASASGVWIATWIDDGPFPDVRVARSVDAGATWTAPQRLNLPDQFSFPAAPGLDTDGQGAWVATFSFLDLFAVPFFDPDIAVVRSLDDGATWSEPEPLNSNAEFDTHPSARDFSPQVSSDGAGTWVAVWHSNSLRGFGDDYDIVAARSLDQGATWTPVAPVNAHSAIDDSGDHDDEPDVATDGEGNWVTTWGFFASTPASGFQSGPLAAHDRLHRCGTAPVTSCVVNTSGQSTLQVQRRTQRLKWIWRGTFPSPIGDPTTTDVDYDLCMYDGSAGTALLVEAQAPGASRCGRRPCWAPLRGQGFRYADPADTFGLSRVDLKGAAGGAGALQVRGRGSALPGAGDPLALPLRVQLQAANGACWESTFSAAAQNDGTRFRASSD